MIVLFFLALASSPQVSASSNVAGHYEAVTETEYSIDLALRSNGQAQYKFVTWEADGSAPEQHEILSGRWSQSGSQLTLRLSSGQVATYTIVPCLSHQEFGQSGCSQGLSLVNTNISERYGLKRFGLWKSAYLQRTVRP
jgi:hypothetical protein